MSDSSARQSVASSNIMNLTAGSDSSLSFVIQDSPPKAASVGSFQVIGEAPLPGLASNPLAGGALAPSSSSMLPAASDESMDMEENNYARDSIPRPGETPDDHMDRLIREKEARERARNLLTSRAASSGGIAAKNPVLSLPSSPTRRGRGTILNTRISSKPNTPRSSNSQGSQGRVASSLEVMELRRKLQAAESRAEQVHRDRLRDSTEASNIIRNVDEQLRQEKDRTMRAENVAEIAMKEAQDWAAQAEMLREQARNVELSAQNAKTEFACWEARAKSEMAQMGDNSRQSNQQAQLMQTQLNSSITANGEIQRQYMDEMVIYESVKSAGLDAHKQEMHYSGLCKHFEQQCSERNGVVQTMENSCETLRIQLEDANAAIQEGSQQLRYFFNEGSKYYQESATLAEQYQTAEMFAQKANECNKQLKAQMSVRGVAGDSNELITLRERVKDLEKHVEILKRNNVEANEEKNVIFRQKNVMQKSLDNMRLTINDLTDKLSECRKTTEMSQGGALPSQFIDSEHVSKAAFEAFKAKANESLEKYRKSLEDSDEENKALEARIARRDETIEQLEYEISERANKAPEDSAEFKECLDATPSLVDDQDAAAISLLAEFDKFIDDRNAAKAVPPPPDPATAQAAPTTGGAPTSEAKVAELADRVGLSKQPKAIVCPTPLPDPVSKGWWMAQLGKNCVASSIYHDAKEMDWIYEILNKTLEELVDSGEERMKKIDQLLAVTMEPKLPKQVMWQYRKLCEEQGKKGKIVQGRQMVWMILDQTKCSEEQAYITTYESLQEMPWYGDSSEQITEMYYEWKRATMNLRPGTISQDTLRDLLHKKFLKSHVFSHDLAHYQRAKDKSTEGNPDPDYSLSFLESLMVRHITLQREKKVKSDIKAAVQKGNRFGGKNQKEEAQPAMAGVDKPPPKKKPTKGNGRAKSEPAPRRDGGKGTGGGNPSGAAPGSGDKKIRTWNEIREYCYFFQKGTCRHQNAKDCPKKHEKLKPEEVAIYQKEVEKSKRERSGSPSKKGDGKGKRPPSPKGSRERSNEPPKKSKGGIEYIIKSGKPKALYCWRFHKNGSCNWEAEKGTKCNRAHWTPDQLNAKQKALEQELGSSVKA